MVMRISGLASGIDTDSIIKDLMKAERMPLDKLKQKKQILEWQRDDYRTMNSLFLDFRTNMLMKMKLSSSYRARTVTSTNDALLTATASSAAALSSASISKVQQLASAARKTNSGTISDSSSKVDTSKSLVSQKFDNGITWKDGSIQSSSITIKDLSDIKINLKMDAAGNNSIKLDPNDSSKIDKSLINIKVNGTAYKVTDTNPPANANEVFVGTDGSLKFNSNDSNVKVDSTIQVDYVADLTVDSSTLKEGTKEWKLSGSNISNFVSLDVDGVTYTYNQATNNLENGTDVIGTLDIEAGKITFTNPGLTSESKVEATYQEKFTNFSLTTYSDKPSTNTAVNQNFLIRASDSLDNVMSEVNESNVGVTMFYDSFSDRMTLTRSQTGNFHGEAAKIMDMDTSSPTYGQLIDNPAYSPTDQNDQEIITSGDLIDNVLKFSNVSETGGDNAVFEINGLQTERTSNTFDISGVTYTIKQTFTDPVSVSISNDTNTVFDNIKAFVDEYNTLIETINNKINETRDRNYQPLTDEQKEQLSDKQQEQWESAAKTGLLKGDSILAGSLSQMRNLIYQPVNNGNVNPVFNQLASIGITTSSNYLDGGKLEINEAELKKAIEEDPGSVENLFNAKGSSDTSKGIVQRLYDSLPNIMDRLSEKAGQTYSTNQQFTIGRNLDSVNKQIDAFNDRLSEIEDRYYRQFTAMEQAIQQSNSQSGYLAQFFSGGN